MLPTTKNLRYDHTPIPPGTPRHVHHGPRPQPPAANLGPVSSAAVVLLAGTTLGVLPVVALFLWMQKEFVEGITLGAVKE